MMRLRRNSDGDTIVEVLISIAVASFVIAGSYAVVNQALKDTQSAQEHSEALLIANTQIELIHHYIRVTPAATLESTLYGNPRFHCFNPATAQLEQLPNIGPSLPDPVSGHYDDPTVPGDDCNKTGSVGFRVAFEYVAGDGSTHGDDLFRVYVNWPSITSKGDDQVKVVYRVGA